MTETGIAAQVWADRDDGILGDIFTPRDNMTISVIGAIGPTSRKAEVERARRGRPESLGAYDVFVRALPFAMAAMPDHTDKALPSLEHAIRLERDRALARGFIAWSHEHRCPREGPHSKTREAGRAHAHAAITSGGGGALTLVMAGFVVAVMERDYPTSLDAIERAPGLMPAHL